MDCKPLPMLPYALLEEMQLKKIKIKKKMEKRKTRPSVFCSFRTTCDCFWLSFTEAT